MDDHDYNDKKINTVFPTILKVEFCLGIDKKKTKDVQYLYSVFSKNKKL